MHFDIVEIDPITFSGSVSLLQKLYPDVTLYDILKRLKDMEKTHHFFGFVSRHAKTLKGLTIYSTVTKLGSGRTLILDSLIVAEPRNGVGSALINHIYEMAKIHNAKAILVDCPLENDDGKSFYTNEEFYARALSYIKSNF